jgi:hypothetical protein
LPQKQLSPAFGLGKKRGAGHQRTARQTSLNESASIEKHDLTFGITDNPSHQACIFDARLPCAVSLFVKMSQNVHMA